MIYSSTIPLKAIIFFIFSGYENDIACDKIAPWLKPISVIFSESIFWFFDKFSINLNNSSSENKKFGKIIIYNTQFNYLEGTSNLIGDVKLDIFNHNQFYKFFPVSKKKRNNRKFSKINFNFTFSLENSEFSIDRINFMDENNKIIQSKNVDDFVEDNYETRFKFSNKVLFKNWF